MRRTVNGGAEVVALLKTGSAFYAPAASVAKMVESILTDARWSLPSCVLLDGQYGLSDVYLSVPAVLGRGGLVDIPEIALDEAEVAALRASAETVAEGLKSLGLRG